MMFDHSKTFRLAFGFAIAGTVIGFGFMQLFPNLERKLADWQIMHLSQAQVSPRIVLVTAPSDGNNVCGEGRWHPEQVETFVGAMKQAGASVVGLLDDFSSGSQPGCGELGSLARLAETTKRVGNVVYPDSVSAMVQNAAAGSGRVNLVPDDDGFLRGLHVPSGNDSEPSWPLGVALAIRDLQADDPFNLSINGGDYRYFSPPATPDFPERSFEEVSNLIQEGQVEALRSMFDGKMLVLSSRAFPDRRISTTWAADPPLATVHAWMANTVLTGSWLTVVPIAWAVSLSCLLGTILGTIILEKTRITFKIFLTLVVGLVCAGGIWLLNMGGRVWPVGGTLLTLSMSAAGALFWRTITSRAAVQRRIREGQHRLTQLQQDLAEKQQAVRELEARLQEARSQTQETVSVVAGLHESQETILGQLQDSERAMANTRVRISQLQRELDSLRQRVPAASSLPDSQVDSIRESLIQECASLHILTRDRTVLGMFQNLKKAALSQSPILLLGETGTGKEVFARAAHALSPRRDWPFISVNMAAIRPELFEGELFGHVKGAFTGAVGRDGLLQAADGGTIFLDEVGELPPDAQAKLLRVLEDGSFYRVGDSRLTTVNVRIVAATNRSLLKEVEAGRYREDLYYRLRSIELTLPPLRERCQEDRILLANAFLAACAGQQKREEMQLTQEAMDAILTYRWPGNIRELRHTIAQAVALTDGPLISRADLQLPKAMGTRLIGKAHGKEDLERMEDLMVLKCLRKHHFDMQATARDLGWDRGTVTQRLKGLGFQALVDHHQDIQQAARALAGDEVLVRIVEVRLREYTKNLIPRTKQYQSAEEAMLDCRKRFRNLPERHFPAVERLIQSHFSSHAPANPGQTSMPQH